MVSTIMFLVVTAFFVSLLVGSYIYANFVEKQLYDQYNIEQEEDRKLDIEMVKRVMEDRLED